MCRTVYAINTVKENIAVGLMLDCSSFIVGSSNEFLVCDTSNKKMKLTRGFIKISCSEEGVCIGKYFLSLPVKVESSNGTIYAQYKPYRGYLIIKKSSTVNKITIINFLPIEYYLK
ncbi:MAG: hypothetical protein LBS78_01940 [Endomicrobium sp.]|nr:hypothetical protein [Endomicrobium sp.]